MDALPPSGEAPASALRRGLMRARLEAALVAPANAVLIGLTGIAAVSCAVAESRGLLNPGTWMAAAAAGATVLLAKVVLDLRDKAHDDALWRSFLARGFGQTMRDDLEVTRLARTAIEYRVRLAMAEAKAPRAARRALRALLPRIDAWLEGIVGLARQVAALRADARFHVAMGSRNRQRLAEVGAAAGAGLDAQVRAADGFARLSEDGLLRLENAVAAFGAACATLVRDLARAQGLEGSAVTDARIGAAIAGLAGDARALEASPSVADPASATPPPPPPA